MEMRRLTRELLSKKKERTPIANLLINNNNKRVVYMPVCEEITRIELQWG
jgi:hypothetical protein